MSEDRKGRKVSEETKEKISKAMEGKNVGENNPMYGKIGRPSPMLGKTHTEETKKKMSESRKGIGLGNPRSEKVKAKISASQPKSQKISVYDLEIGIQTIYDSLQKAAKALNCSASSLLLNMRSKGKKPYKGRFELKRLD
jgi:group I intron endonuclease